MRVNFCLLLVVSIALVSSEGCKGKRHSKPADGFKVASDWSAFDAGNTDSLVTKGYYGAVSDGRYIYYAPCRTENFHGRVLRYDTASIFTAAASYDAYDAGLTDGLQTKGYAGAVFDGRYVYFVPYANIDPGYDGAVRHARVLRYDTRGLFKDVTSWSAYDASGIPGIPPLVTNFLGYDGAIYDGQRYIYFVPYGDQIAETRNTYALRYDTQGNFKSAGSWRVYDIRSIDGMVTKGYYGAAFDGRYVYYVPYANGPENFHGRAVRYDTRGEYTVASSWSAYDAGSTDGMKTVGYKGAVFDGRYVYYVPFRETESVQHSRVLRYDTYGNFKTTSNWSAYDASQVDGLNTQGYVGAEFDGRYIYFIPYQQNTTFHANVLRYDTQGDFKTASNWSAYDAGATDGLPSRGYKYSTKHDGFIYFVPYNNNEAYSGIVLRYDSRRR